MRREREGYSVYQDVELTIKSSFEVLLRTAIASLVMALLCVLLAILVTGSFGESVWGVFLELALRLAGSDFRSGVMDVGAIVAGLVVALAALSWVRHKRPVGEGGWHVARGWLIGVLDDARREDVAIDLMHILAMCFGALVAVFWVSVCAAKYCGIQVAGDAFVGVILAFISGVIALSPLLLRPSGNGQVRDYSVVLRNIILWVRWECFSGWSNFRKQFSWRDVVVRFVVVSMVGAVMFGAAWWVCAGLASVGAAVFYGMACPALVWLMVEDIPDLILGRPFVKFVTAFNFVSTSVVAFVFPCFVATRSFGLGRAWLVVAVGLVWLIVVCLLVFCGARIPVLKDLVCFRLCRCQAELGKTFSDLTEGEMLYDWGDLDEVTKILIPKGSVIAESRSGVFCMKVWSQRAEMMVPETGKPHKPGPYDVDLRAYIVETLGIVLPGTGVPELTSRVRSSNSAIDEWHIDSSY